MGLMLFVPFGRGLRVKVNVALRERDRDALTIKGLLDALIQVPVDLPVVFGAHSGPTKNIDGRIAKGSDHDT